MSTNKRTTMVLTILLSVIGANVHAQQEVSHNTQIPMFDGSPGFVAKLDNSAAADSLVTEKCYDLLGEWMRMNGGTNGQLAVIDTQAGQLVAWAALEDAGGNHIKASLRKDFCSSEVYMPFVAAECLALSNTSLEDYVDTGSGVFKVNDNLTIRDHNWRRGGYGRLTYRQALLYKSRIGMYHAMMTAPNGMDYWNLATDMTKNTNAMELADTFNSIYYSGNIALPTPDSVEAGRNEVDIDETKRRYIHEIAVGMFKEGGIQHKRAPKDVELAGVYNLADDGKEQAFTFIGCFPADKPRYAIGMVVQRKHKQPASSVMLASAVNELIEWLNHKTE